MQGLMLRPLGMIFILSFLMPSFAFAQTPNRNQTLPQSIKSFRDLDDEKIVRVRLQKQIQKLEITGRFISVANQEAVVQPIALNSDFSKIIITKQFFQRILFWQVVEYKAGRLFRTQLLGQKYLSIQGQDLRLGTKALPERLLLSGLKNFDLIGSVRLREYLIGVVSSEMPLSWPIEALKAQAIASRSYAYSLMQNRTRNSFQLESSILDQVYSPVENLQWRPAKMENVIRAVDETRGVLLLKNQKILKAYYHADCGGKTASSASVFGTQELEGGVIDSSCPLNPKARWAYKIPKKTLGARVAQFFHSPGIQVPLKRFYIMASNQSAQESASERVQTVALEYANGLERRISTNQLREILGYQELKSTQFSLQEKGGVYTFKGSGYGHGVGLCQWGTKNLASQGMSHTQILLHYYPEAQLNVLSLKSADNFQSEETNSRNNHHVF